MRSCNKPSVGAVDPGSALRETIAFAVDTALGLRCVRLGFLLQFSKKPRSLAKHVPAVMATDEGPATLRQKCLPRAGFELSL